MRPVAEMQIFDFVTHMMDMIVNQAAKFRYMLGGKPTVPLVIRGPQGGGIRLAAQHSPSLEAWFAHVPGLVVLAPSTPYDAKGLLISAIRDDNPVIFLEHKLLYVGKKAPVPEEPYAIPIGKAAIKRTGTDVTLVATMAMVEPALQAAEPPGERRHRRGGDRSAHAAAAGRGDDPQIGKEDQSPGDRPRRLEALGLRCGSRRHGR